MEGRSLPELFRVDPCVSRLYSDFPVMGEVTHISQILPEVMAGIAERCKRRSISAASIRRGQPGIRMDPK